MIAVGQKLPNATLSEFIHEESDGCPLGPNAFQVEELVAGKKIVVFALPGAFTPTCSAEHVPSYIQHYDAIKAKGVDEIWCISVNDAFVMGAWGKDQKVGMKIRMMADGSAEFTKKMGTVLDLTAHGLGVRSDRYAMIVEDGVVTSFDREAPGKFEIRPVAKNNSLTDHLVKTVAVAVAVALWLLAGSRDSDAHYMDQFFARG